MYTVGKCLGLGRFSCFFTLRGYSKLGVKVRKDNNKGKLELRIKASLRKKCSGLKY